MDRSVLEKFERNSDKVLLQGGLDERTLEYTGPLTDLKAGEDIIHTHVYYFIFLYLDFFIIKVRIIESIS